MKIVAISDTHLRKFSIPDGDILIHAGDLTFDGSIRQTVEGFNKLESELKSLNFREKIFVPGNHDWIFQNNTEMGKAIAKEFDKDIKNMLESLKINFKEVEGSEKGLQDILNYLKEA